MAALSRDSPLVFARVALGGLNERPDGYKRSPRSLSDPIFFSPHPLKHPVSSISSAFFRSTASLSFLQRPNPPPTTFKMKFFVAILALAATAIAAPTECKSCHKEPSHEHKPEHKEPSNNKVGNVCQSHQTVVCQGQGNGGLLSLGNILPGALGQSCSGGDVYCCSHDDVKQTGLINLDLNVQCSLTRLL
ncbi:hypothetical protein JDV02_008396 [Purpureocillium takamizusanense]|uniref:Hydrophobin n=1 Tax=Purpureocillium takamizusanense TaxID=2060973 RepID=A0A9Q8QNK8_9HYPO|nr:uncharacterized protein JDV02_008396 [Purpureocillium takamizusanense]UNI22512.1 hypothetical protein JDV02_008396 [Purpureocillium takamizusanense]